MGVEGVGEIAKAQSSDRQGLTYTINLAVHKVEPCLAYLDVDDNDGSRANGLVILPDQQPVLNSCKC